MTIDEYYNIMAELNCAVIETDLPSNCKAFTLKNECEYAVYLNNNQPAEIMKIALEHELDHIRKGDFTIEL